MMSSEDINNKKQFYNPTYEHEEHLTHLYDVDEIDLYNTELDLETGRTVDYIEVDAASSIATISKGHSPKPSTSSDSSADAPYEFVERPSGNSNWLLTGGPIGGGPSVGGLNDGGPGGGERLTFDEDGLPVSRGGDNSYWTRKKPRYSQRTRGGRNVYREPTAAENEKFPGYGHNVKFIQESGCPWKRLLVIFVVLLALAALAYLIYYLVTREDDKPSVITESKQIDGEFIVTNRQYYDILNSRESEAYQTLSSDIIAQLDDVFLTSDLRDVYTHSIINHFSRGSIIVNFTSYFREARSQDDLHTSAMDGFSAYLDAPSQTYHLSSYRIPEQSLTLVAVELELHEPDKLPLSGSTKPPVPSSSATGAQPTASSQRTASTGAPTTHLPPTTRRLTAQHGSTTRRPAVITGSQSGSPTATTPVSSSTSTRAEGEGRSTSRNGGGLSGDGTTRRSTTSEDTSDHTTPPAPSTTPPIGTRSGSSTQHTTTHHTQGGGGGGGTDDDIVTRSTTSSTPRDSNEGGSSSTVTSGSSSVGGGTGGDGGAGGGSTRTTTGSTTTIRETMTPSSTVRTTPGGAGPVDGGDDPLTGTVELVGSAAQPWSGQVVVTMNGQRGTVCSAQFGTTEAYVLCRSLGCDTTDSCALRSQSTPPPPVGPSSPILLDVVRCSGSEADIFSCYVVSRPAHSACTRHQDLYVSCGDQPTVMPAPPSPPTGGTTTPVAGTPAVVIESDDGSLRLNGGRLEYRDRSVWGSVCGRGFGLPEARVACRQLGLSPTAVYSIGLRSDLDNAEHIAMYNLRCTGYEDHLDDCHGNTWVDETCIHEQDVSLQCGEIAHPYNVQLDDGTSGDVHPHEGVLTVQLTERGPVMEVCDYGFTLQHAMSVCQHLGFTSQAPELVRDGVYGRTDVSGTLRTRCSDGEGYCSTHAQWRSATCAAQRLVRINCAPQLYRLAGGILASQGRLEVRSPEGQWSTVCAESRTRNERLARHVCAELGYHGTSGLPVTRIPGPDTAPISVLQCEDAAGAGAAMESTPDQDLSRCGWEPADDSFQCSHHQDLFISCAHAYNSPESVLLRLSGGSSPSVGRLEVYYEGRWGTVCREHFGVDDGRVACRQMGYSGLGEVMQAGHQYTVADHTTPIWVTSIGCLGTEQYLAQCAHQQWGKHRCHHAQDVALRCSEESTDSTTQRAGGVVNDDGSSTTRPSAVGLSSPSSTSSGGAVSSTTHRSAADASTSTPAGVSNTTTPAAAGTSGGGTATAGAAGAADPSSSTPSQPQQSSSTTAAQGGAAGQQSTTQQVVVTTSKPGVTTRTGGAGGVNAGDNTTTTTTTTTESSATVKTTVASSSDVNSTTTIMSSVATGASTTSYASVSKTTGNSGGGVAAGDEQQSSTRPTSVVTAKPSTATSAQSSTTKANSQSTTTPQPTRQTSTRGGGAASGDETSTKRTSAATNKPSTTASAQSSTAHASTTLHSASTGGGGAAAGDEQQSSTRMTSVATAKATTTTNSQSATTPQTTRQTSTRGGGAAAGDEHETSTKRTSVATAKPPTATRSQSPTENPSTTPRPSTPTQSTKSTTGGGGAAAGDEHGTSTRGTSVVTATSSTSRATSRATTTPQSTSQPTTKSTTNRRTQSTTKETSRPSTAAPSTTNGAGGLANDGSGSTTPHPAVAGDQSSTSRATETSSQAASSTARSTTTQDSSSDKQHVSTTSKPSVTTKVARVTTQPPAGGVVGDVEPTTRRGEAATTTRRPATATATPTAATHSTLVVQSTTPGTCELVTISECHKYSNQTQVSSATNPFRLSTQQEIQATLAQYRPLISVQCHQTLEHFLCAVFLPKCEHGVLYRPCASYCRSVQSSCGQLLSRFGIDWPDELNCDYSTNFPTENCQPDPTA